MKIYAHLLIYETLEKNKLFRKMTQKRYIIRNSTVFLPKMLSMNLIMRITIL